jgi:hypothetical protein
MVLVTAATISTSELSKNNSSLLPLAAGKESDLPEKHFPLPARN